MATRAASRIIPPERIERAILLIRGERVLLDRDLARLYGVSTGDLNQAVSRNLDRFPSDFMFQITGDEFANLISQTVTSSWGGTRKLPRAFTEQGVAMLSSVLRSRKAVRVNIEIVRTFVRLRRLIASHADLARKIEELDEKYDRKFTVVFDAINQLMAPPAPVEGQSAIGFLAQEPMTLYRRRPRKTRPAPAAMK